MTTSSETIQPSVGYKVERENSSGICRLDRSIHTYIPSCIQSIICRFFQIAKVESYFLDRMIEQLSFIHFQQILKKLDLVIYFIIENRKATIKDKLVPPPISMKRPYTSLNFVNHLYTQPHHIVYLVFEDNFIMAHQQ